MPSRWFVTAYVAWLVTLAVIFLTIRSSQATVVALTGLTASATMASGVHRNRPARRWRWYCLTAAVLLSTAGQVILRLLPGRVGTYQPGSLYLYGVLVAMSALILSGVLGLARHAPRDLSAVVDVAILLLGTGLLVGVLIAVPYAVTPDLPGIQVAARIFFVARDVALLAATVHFSTSERWNGAMALLVSGVVGLLAYDSASRLGLINGVILLGTGVELGWLLFAGSWGMAALLPAMKRLGEPGAQARRSIPLRLSLLAAASVLPVALLMLITYQPTRPWYEPLVVAGAAIMLALVLTQLLAVALRLRNQVLGEQALSRAVAQVAATSDRPGVAAALENNVPLLGTGRATGSLAAAVDLRPPARDPMPSEEPPGSMVENPPAHLRGRLGPGPVLAYPLCTDSEGERLILYLRGKRTALDQLWPRLDVLATQACLVLERIRLNAQLIRSTTEEYLNAVAQTSGDAILLVDDTDRITLASRSAGPILGTSNVIGARLPDLVNEAAREAVTDLLRRARWRELQPRAAAPDGGAAGNEIRLPHNVTVEPQESVNTASWTVRRGDGTEAELEIACRQVASIDSSVQGLLVDVRDVTEQRRLERDLSQRSSHDPITGLMTGLSVRERIRRDIETRPEALIAMIVLDLNDFDLVNNQYGHDVGDEVLRTVARRLSAALPPSGFAGRVSGDRFAVILDIATPADADMVATELLAAVAQPVRLGQDVVTCTASAGIATTADTKAPSDLARQADLALLIARDRGRGRWHHFDPNTRSDVIERLQMRAALEHALDEHALSLLYQPIVDLKTGTVAGFEALIRWQHPTYGRLSPATYLRVAEESDLIVPIGDWALDTAVQDARSWAAEDPPPFVAVNVTATQFGWPGFYDSVRNKLASSGLVSSRLHLEITESTLLSDDAIWTELQQLRELGVQIAIDDFGTGYSALSYLGRVPVDRIKLDRHFVASMSANPAQRDLVDGIVKLAQILHLDVIAEGIETSQDRDLVAEAGCRFGQGYLFARPMPAEATRTWLVQERARIAALALSHRETVAGRR